MFSYRTGFCKQRWLNPQEIKFNGVYGAFVGSARRKETGRKLAIDTVVATSRQCGQSIFFVGRARPVAS
jgi:hypothetical protein